MILSTYGEMDEYYLIRKPRHVARVWKEIEAALPTYWTKFVENETKAAKKAKKRKSSAKDLSDGAILTQVFGDAIASFEKTAAEYRKYFSPAAFEEYQEHAAWSWEHQALTRARYCAGDRDVGMKFEAIRERILRRQRDPAALAKDVVSMREKLHAAHPNKSGLFDLKHDRGGMIDIEFTVQYLVLAHSRPHAELTRNLGNIALLGIAAGLGLIDADIAEKCRNAYRKFRRLQHALRLNGARYARVPPEQVAAKSEAVRNLWQAVFSAYQ